MEQLGPYRLLNEIARGGMGVVYRAQDTRSGQAVALKVLLDLSDLELLERFRRETTLLRELDHPNLVRVLDVCLQPPRPYAVFELVEGGTLKQRVEREGPLPWPTAARLLSEVAAGVAAAHERDLLHRDIKPENVLLTESGAKLADFGLVKDLNQETLTQSGSTLGTPSYLAPEQASSDKARWGPATDVYGLAATLYFALTGVPPFTGPTTIAILQAVTTDPPPSPRRQVSGVPPWLDALCTRGLAKLGSERFRTALSFRAALLHGAAAAAPRRLGVALALALPLALGAALGAAWLVGGGRPSELASAPPSSQPDPLPGQPQTPSPPRDEGSALDADPAPADDSAPPDQDPLTADERREVDAALEVANARLNEKSFTAAIPHLDHAIELDPNCAKAFVWRGIAHRNSGNPTRAVSDYTRALELELDDPDILRRRGVTQIESRQPEKALEDLGRAIELDPTSPMGHRNRVQAYLQLGRFEEALADLEQVLVHEPRDPAAFLSRGIVKLKLGRPAEALADLDRSIQLGSKGPVAYLRRVQALVRLGRDAEALEAFELGFQQKNLARFPKLANQVRGAYEVASARLAGQPARHVQALEELTRALELDPDNPASFRARGQVLVELERHVAAHRDFDAAVRLRPGDPQLLVHREATRATLNLLREAIADYSEALRLDSNHVEALHRRGAALRALGQQQAALADFTRAIKADPDNPRRFMTRGLVYAQMGRLEEGLQDLDRALDLDPNHAGSYRVRGDIKGQLERYEQAVADYDRSLDLMSTSGLCYASRGSAKANLGRYEEAVVDYDRALKAGLSPEVAADVRRRRAQAAAQPSE